MFCLICVALLSVFAYYALRFMWELLRVGNLDKKAVVVTGCDSGFGRLLVLKLVCNGIPVYAGCLSQEGLDSLKKEAESAGGKLRPLQLDVTSDESVSAAVKFVKGDLKEGEKVWALVNNAGLFAAFGPDDWTPLAEFERSFAVNTLGTIRVSHAFKRLLKQSSGRLISASSIAGRQSVPGMVSYSVAKYGVEAYMDAIRQELRPWGVTVCILEPGGFRTGFVDASAMEARIAKAWKSLDEETRLEYGEEFRDKSIEAQTSTHFEYVVDNYFHAIVARFPRSRYHCGWDALLFVIPSTFLPTCLQDALYRFVATKEAKANIPAIFKTNDFGKFS